ncbi:MAG: cysteine desulfurase family protein [Cyclonatronaceae bacterium]
MHTVYLDNAATSPIDPGVLEAMLPFLRENFGNASSIHHMGRKASVAVETWRSRIAQHIGAQASEIIFTSGGTESNNAALFGALENRPGKQIITARTEHNAVLFPVERAQKTGYDVIYLDLDEHGRATPDALEKVLDEQTALVSLMHVNNETGLINPVAEHTALCRERGIPFHCDTVQSVGKMPLNVDELGVDFLSMSAHKFHGPKGAGVLYVRSGSPWSAWMHGGSQERGRRGGTLNVAGIAGLGKALDLAHEQMHQNMEHVAGLRKRLLNGFRESLGPQIRINGDPENGLPHILSVTVTDGAGEPLDGEMLLLNLDIEGICCSNGSACTSGTIKPSHVMLALGHDQAMAKSTLRFSLSKYNTVEEMDKAVKALSEVVGRHSGTAHGTL